MGESGEALSRRDDPFTVQLLDISARNFFFFFFQQWEFMGVVLIKQNRFSNGKLLLKSVGVLMGSRKHGNCSRRREQSLFFSRLLTLDRWEASCLNWNSGTRSLVISIVGTILIDK